MWAAFASSDITLSLTKDHLRFSLPTQAKFTIQTTAQGLEILIQDDFKEKEWSKALMPPFSLLQLRSIHPNQTLLLIQAQNQTLSYSYSKDSDAIHFSVWAIPSISWWRYFAVLALLIVLIGFLLFLKKRQRIKNLPQTFQFHEFYLNKSSKIITLQNQNKVFTIFSNEQGCVLLESKDLGKEFTLKED